MRHLLLIWMFLLSVQICWADFVDPTDLFHFDEMNIELSKKRHERNYQQKPDESADGKQESSGSPPSPSEREGVLTNQSPPPKIEDAEDKNTEASVTPTSSSNIKKQDDISTKQSSPSNIGEYERNNFVQEPVLHCKDETMTKAVFSLFQQFVMNFVQLSQGMVGDSSRPVDFCMRIKASEFDLSVLRKFGEGDDSAVHAAHDKLSNVFQSACDLPDSGPILWLEKRLGLSTTVLCLILVCLLTLFFIVKTLTTIRLTCSKIWFSMIAVFVTSVAFTWMEMYQKKVADQERTLTSKMDAICPQYEKLGTWERFTNYISATVTFQDENCREFYEAMFINPVIQVSPLEAVAVAVVKTFVAPCKIIGEGIKGLLIGLFKDLPAQYAGLLVFLMTLLPAVVLLYLPLLAFGYKIRIPFFLSIEPTPKPQVIEVERKNAIELDKEHGSRDHNAIQDSASTRPHANAIQDQKAIEEVREEQGQGDAIAKHQTETQKPMASATSPSNQSWIKQSQVKTLQNCQEEKKQNNDLSSKWSKDIITDSQVKALQKCQKEQKKKNDLSEWSKDNTTSTTDSKEQPGKGLDSASTTEAAAASNQETMFEDRIDTTSEDFDSSFIVLQPFAHAESNKVSEIKNSGDADDNDAKASEEENFNLPGDCDEKIYDKDLHEWNIRDT